MDDWPEDPMDDSPDPDLEEEEEDYEEWDWARTAGLSRDELHRTIDAEREG